ncbi:DnaB-like helicase C-terminal domain-containing protein [Rhizobium leguminosarum]|uniref:DnaB-like helicase C-terminal domain-containing protein n=1 Tax=Rhizobium leguminosarum TaxID=384 RepID=UPI001C956186|nr:DnaB-like helicase C-terminal domain-containing protein [Rhizobium leguminosarum]MBY5581840.1 toprim domain-containing protein [Rhizobium leguminosarum]
MEASDDQVERPKSKNLLPIGEPSDWSSRKIDLESATKWGFTRSEMGGEAVRIFNYRNINQQIVAQKVRTASKDFVFLGDTKNAGLYGMHLWRDGGRKLIITEGEIDAISISKAQGHKWPVVSLPTGANGAKGAIKKNLEWINTFDEVILCFDMDEPGRIAVDECVQLFEPGKCKTAILPRKDANEMLMHGEVKELIDCLWGAKVLRPDGIVDGSDLWDLMEEDDTEDHFDLPWLKINEMTLGGRSGELITLTAGSGMGKSAVIREVVDHLLLTTADNLGILMLEEPIKRTARGLVGIRLSKPIHLDKDLATAEERRAAYEATVGSGRVFLYDHFGSTSSDNLLAKIRYLAKGCGCKRIFLDHLSIVVSGQEDGDERRNIDFIMTALATLALECDITIFLVTHLKRPSGDKGHEQGAEVSLAQLRGSHSIAQLSHTVIGIERNQQSDEEVTVGGQTLLVKEITTLRVLKCRWTGETGLAGWLSYNRKTGRLSELHSDPYADKGEKSNRGVSSFEDESDDKDIPF